MKERPILFSGPMVRALLDGAKTQTRRVMKPQPICNGFGAPGPDTDSEIPCYEGSYPPSAMLWPNEHGGMLNGDAGHPWFGIDRLWVRETFHSDPDHNRVFYKAEADEATGREVPYLMDGADGFGGGVGHAIIRKWTPSIFMRRRDSRIILELIDVRAERLQSINLEDCIAEGIKMRGCSIAEDVSSLIQDYATLWESINGAGSWEKNPYVWVISFKRITP